jgi:hypothetical protein
VLSTGTIVYAGSNIPAFRRHVTVFLKEEMDDNEIRSKKPVIVRVHISFNNKMLITSTHFACCY